LTDFGLSANYAKGDGALEAILEEVQDLLHGRCPSECPFDRERQPVGTHRYMAPEVFKRESPTFASDYWSLGVIFYEMLYGYPPFLGKSPGESALRILHWRKSLRFPARKGVSAEAVDLLRHLLCDADTRYGFESLAAHPFFRGFDFANVGANIPPLVPVLRHPADTAHFDRVAEEAQSECEVPSGSLASVLFLGFTYTKPPKNRTLAGLGVFDGISG
jgi:serine/threonine protein kinase